MDLAIQGGLSPPRLPVSPPGRCVSRRSRPYPANRCLRPTVSCHRCRTTDRGCGSRSGGSPSPSARSASSCRVCRRPCSSSSPRRASPGRAHDSSSGCSTGPVSARWSATIDPGSACPARRRPRRSRRSPSCVRSARSSPRAAGCCARSSSPPARSASPGSCGACRPGRTATRTVSCRRGPMVPVRRDRRGDHLARSARRHGGQVRRQRIGDRRADLRTDPRRRRARLLRGHAVRRAAAAVGQPDARAGAARLRAARVHPVFEAWAERTGRLHRSARTTARSTAGTKASRTPTRSTRRSVSPRAEIRTERSHFGRGDASGGSGGGGLEVVDVTVDVDVRRRRRRCRGVHARSGRRGRRRPGRRRTTSRAASPRRALHERRRGSAGPSAPSFGRGGECRSDAVFDLVGEFGRQTLGGRRHARAVARVDRASRAGRCRWRRRVHAPCRSAPRRRPASRPAAPR